MHARKRGENPHFIHPNKEDLPLSYFLWVWLFVIQLLLQSWNSLNTRCQINGCTLFKPSLSLYIYIYIINNFFFLIYERTLVVFVYLSLWEYIFTSHGYFQRYYNLLVARCPNQYFFIFQRCYIHYFYSNKTYLYFN